MCYPQYCEYMFYLMLSAGPGGGQCKRTWPDTAALTGNVQCVVDGRAPVHHTAQFPPLGQSCPTIRHSNNDTLQSSALLTALLHFL